MKHLGDITKLNGAEVPVVDCITGGSPCQDLSVAGKRAGLNGERSGLFMDQIRIVKEMRENDRKNGRAGKSIRPRFMVWENVPGAFSSNEGEDFRAVIEETARIAECDTVIPRPEGGWRAAGAVMGNGWSIAWRLHDAQFWGVPQRRRRIGLVADFGGQSAPEILFERKGVSGDIAEGRTAREGIAETAERSIDSAISFQDSTAYRKTAHPIKIEDGQGWEETKVNDTLNAFDNTESRTPTLICFDPRSQDGVHRIHGSICPTINTAQGGQWQPCVTYQNEKPKSVRRLTPLEYERLQGFPDGWTDIGSWTDTKGKLHKESSDSARYKALGNSIALPFWKWLLKRISDQYDRPATMGSLFDGIGGFPLCWEECNGKGSAIWASEIEEFPIAVTKKHFPEIEKGAKHD